MASSPTTPGPWSVLVPQVGHVQRLGSLPVSLLQLPPPPPDPLRRGPPGAPPAAVAMALAERSWLLRRGEGGAAARTAVVLATGSAGRGGHIARGR